MADEKQPTVIDGVLQRTSPSALELFKERCETAWWLRYVAGAEEKILPSIRAAQNNGTAAHKELEDYQKGGPVEAVRDVFAKALLPYCPPLGPDLIVEGRTDGLTAAGVPVTGRIDWAHGRLPTRPIVADWKTRKDLDKYAKTEAELRKDIQMGSYARWALLRYPGAKSVDVAHYYVETKKHVGYMGVRKDPTKLPPPRTQDLLVNFSIDATLELWSDIEQSVERMKGVASVKKEDATTLAHPKDMRAKDAACQKFGGCGFKWTCPHSPVNTNAKARGLFGFTTQTQQNGNGKSMGTLTDLLKKTAPGATAAGPGFTPPDMPGNTTPPAPAPAVEAKMEAKVEAKPEPTPPAPEPAPAPQPPPVQAAPTPAAAAEAEHEHTYNMLGVCAGPKGCGRKKPGRKPAAAAEGAPALQDAPAVQAAPTPPPPPPPAAEPAPAPEPKVYRAHDEKRAAPAPALAFGNLAESGFRLYVNCSSSLPSGDLSSYVATVANEVAEAAKVPELRFAPKDSLLAYGGWKGALAAHVKNNPPAKSGRWVIHTRGDEVAETVAAALAGVAAEVVRG